MKAFIFEERILWTLIKKISQLINSLFFFVLILFQYYSDLIFNFYGVNLINKGGSLVNHFDNNPQKLIIFLEEKKKSYEKLSYKKKHILLMFFLISNVFMSSNSWNIDFIKTLIIKIFLWFIKEWVLAQAQVLPWNSWLFL